MDHTHQERGTPACRPSGRPSGAATGFRPPASHPVLGSGPDGFRWAIETPGGPVPLKGVGLPAAAEQGHEPLAAPSATHPEPLAAAGRARASRRRPSPRRVRSALRLTAAVLLSSARRPRRGHLAAATCLVAATLAAASAVSFEGGFELVGAAHFFGTLAPAALAILAWRLLAAFIASGPKRETNS
jgi:hypothetical protein